MQFLILPLSVSSVMSSMDKSRVSSLHSKAVGTARWYADVVVSDELAIDTKVLGNITVSNQWQCLGDLINRDNTSNYYGKSLFELASLSEADVVATGIVIQGDDEPKSNKYCSAIRRNTNREIEVLLVASNNSKFAVSNKKVTYAFSSQTTGKTK